MRTGRQRRALLTKVSSLPANFTFGAINPVGSLNPVTGCVNPVGNLVGKATGSRDAEDGFLESNLMKRRRKKNRPMITIDVLDDGHVRDLRDQGDVSRERGDKMADDGQVASSAFCLSPLSPVGNVQTRKLSDITIVDEESANLTQYLIPNYPELDVTGQCGDMFDKDVASLDSLSWNDDDDISRDSGQSMTIDDS